MSRVTRVLQRSSKGARVKPRSRCRDGKRRLPSVVLTTGGGPDGAVGAPNRDFIAASSSMVRVAHCGFTGHA
jgi:hypothetical protein